MPIIILITDHDSSVFPPILLMLFRNSTEITARVSTGNVCTFDLSF